MTTQFGVDGSEMFENNDVQWTNRGRTPAASYLYWDSPGHVDITGAYYPYEGTVAFATLTEVIGVAMKEDVP